VRVHLQWFAGCDARTGVKNQERKAINVKYYAADVGPAIGAIARLIVLLGRAFGENGWLGGLLVLLVVVGGFAVWYVRNRMSNGNGEDAPTQEVASVKSTIPSVKSPKVKCYRCQHVQTVSASLSTFECEQCNARLKRSVGPKRT
jgi:ribosomal protein S27E